MTKEVKVGLLVGLMFLLVLGVLLSDHFRGTMEPPTAPLANAGATVRQGVNSPGSNVDLPPVVMAPVEVNPHGTVPTPRDINPAQPPVVISMQPPASGAQAPGAALPANDPLVRAAQAQGEQVVPADGNSGTVSQPIQVAAERTYVALAGDSVSRMAARLLGANTAKNRQAIIQANPSLQANPNMVVVGQSYAIPVAGSAGASVAGGTSTPSLSASIGSQFVYTVKEGDTLWGIATGQLGKASAIEAIKELNRDQLHGTNKVVPGMKLRLPSAPLAIAE